MSEQSNKIFTYLSVAQKAGKVVSGEKAVISALKKNRVKSVLLAENASERTKRVFKQYCIAKAIPIIEYGSKEKLGQVIGKLPRAVIAIIDEHFAQIILEQSNQCGQEGKIRGNLCGENTRIRIGENDRDK